MPISWMVWFMVSSWLAEVVWLSWSESRCCGARLGVILVRKHELVNARIPLNHARLTHHTHMDLLSRLLALIPVSGTVDVRCHYGAPWRHPYPAAQLREIPYHILLRGSALVESDDAPPLRMGAGDILLFPSGEAHVLVDDSGEPARERRRSSCCAITCRASCWCAARAMPTSATRTPAVGWHA